MLSPSLMRAQLRAALPPEEQPRGACHVLDAKYHPGVRCVVLYRLGGRLVRGELCFDGRGEGDESTAPVDTWGIRISPYPDDPELPKLRQALAPGALEAALEAMPPTAGGGRPRVLRTRATLLRYRPGRRATLLIDVRLRTPSGARSSAVYVGKVYHDAAKAAAVHADTSLLVGTPSALSGRIALATPVANLADLAMTLQAPVAGAPLDLLLSRAVSTGVTARARGGVLRAADALAALHAAPPVSGRRRPVTDELAKLTHRAGRVAAVDPDVGARLVVLAEALLESVPECADARLVHGDCKPSQFHVARDSVALLDFDHCGLADPACDVGTFLATLRQLHLKQTSGTGGGSGLLALEDDFLRTYLAADGGGRDLAARARWYESVALIRKALRAYARAPRSPLPPLLAEAAHACLGTYASAETRRPRRQGRPG